MAYTFDDLEFKDHDVIPDGIQAVMEFSNGYGVSVIRGFTTRGGRNGLYELAVLFGGNVCTDSGITRDVEGFLNPDDVTKLMGRVQALP